MVWRFVKRAYISPGQRSPLFSSRQIIASIRQLGQIRTQGLLSDCLPIPRLQKTNSLSWNPLPSLIFLRIRFVSVSNVLFSRLNVGNPRAVLGGFVVRKKTRRRLLFAPCQRKWANTGLGLTKRWTAQPRDSFRSQGLSYTRTRPLSMYIRRSLFFESVIGVVPNVSQGLRMNATELHYPYYTAYSIWFARYECYNFR